MFARVSTVVAAFALFAGALAAPGGYENQQCNGGEIRCCESTQDSKSFSEEYKGLIAQLAQVDVKQVTGTIGVQCSSVNVLALGGGPKCNQQTVCCQNNNFSEPFDQTVSLKTKF